MEYDGYVHCLENGVVSFVYMCQNIAIIHFKYVYIIVYQLNINKANIYIIYLYIDVHTHPYISRFMRLLTVSP